MLDCSALQEKAFYSPPIAATFPRHIIAPLIIFQVAANPFLFIQVLLCHLQVLGEPCTSYRAYRAICKLKKGKQKEWREVGVYEEIEEKGEGVREVREGKGEYREGEGGERGGEVNEVEG